MHNEVKYMIWVLVFLKDWKKTLGYIVLFHLRIQFFIILQKIECQMDLLVLLSKSISQKLSMNTQLNHIQKCWNFQFKYGLKCRFFIIKSNATNEDMEQLSSTKKHFDSGKFKLTYQFNLNLDNYEVGEKVLLISITFWFLLTQNLFLLDLYSLRLVCKKTFYIVSKRCFKKICS